MTALSRLKGEGVPDETIDQFSAIFSLKGLRPAVALFAAASPFGEMQGL
jgi:hypothetical protein